MSNERQENPNTPRKKKHSFPWSSKGCEFFDSPYGSNNREAQLVLHDLPWLI